MSGALSDLRVLDLTRHISGPYCTKLLAEFGAEVIKVETPGAGDPSRRIGPFVGDLPHPEKSGLFLYLNTGKKSITLDLRCESGKKLLKELARDVDVVVENFEAGILEGLGLGYEALSQINPSLVMTSISSFGQTGPYKEYKGTDIVEMAMGGLMYITGSPKREPLKYAGSQSQYVGGAYGATGTMLACMYRDSTGIGQHVDVSVMEAVISSLSDSMITYQYEGKIRMRLGGLNWAVHPSHIMPCKDGYILVSILTQGRWGDFCQFMNRPDLGEDPRFQTGIGRVSHAKEIDAAVEPWVMQWNREELFQAAQAWRLPFSLVLTTEDLLKDPQLIERKYFERIEHPVAGTFDYPGRPFQMSETPYKVSRAPFLGEHNIEIYCGRLGLSREDLVRLRTNAVI
ncbi:MAG: CoA transferase [Chloroflexi bacterium]|nr:CoA transferase [Chloroflexota bacterium]